MPILKSIPPESYVEVSSDGKNDTLSRAQEHLTFIANGLTTRLETFEAQFPGLRVSSIRIDRIDTSSSGDPDREIIHRVVIETVLKS